MEAPDVDPVPGVRLLCELNAPPVTEGDAESSARHGLDKLVELGLPVEESVVEGLGDVLGYVASNDPLVLHELDVNYHRIPGDCIPCPPEIGLGDVEPVQHAVHVDIPTLGGRTPLYFSEGTSAIDAFFPECPVAKSSEALVEPVNLSGKWAVVDLESKRQKPDRIAFECLEHVSCQHA
jgi:hypothetical protein